MKKSFLTISCLIIFLFSSQDTLAQVTLKRFGLGYSQWTRTYNGFDERVFFSSAYNTVNDFKKKGTIPYISAELNLYKGLGLEGRLGRWKGDFVNDFSFGDDQVSERISQRIIPLSLNLSYSVKMRPWFYIYGGSGLNRYFLQETVERTVTPGQGSVAPRTYTGSNYGWNVMIGTEFWILPNVGIALEARNHFGKYTKTFVPVLNGEQESYAIDLKGLDLGISLRFRLDGNKIPTAEPMAVDKKPKLLSIEQGNTELKRMEGTAEPQEMKRLDLMSDTKAKEDVSLPSENMAPGIYAVNGVFRYRRNAMDELNKLKLSGMTDVQVGYRASSGLYYLWLMRSDVEEEVVDFVNRSRENGQLKTVWLLRIN